MGLSFLIRFLLTSGFVTALLWGRLVHAETVYPFEGVLVEVTSNNRVLLVADGDKITKFRLSDLEKITIYETEIPEIWNGEEGKYQGVLLEDILALAGVMDVESIRLVALDGYLIELDKEILQNKCAFIATRFRKKEIAVEEKGPTRLLLPCGVKNPDYESTSTSNWIWNLKEIHIE
ncbi:hypothetical protein [Kiloniella antarctica]|uniref:Oxidoreductase molybdopterin-binding domain-containing protein n=1 Tax=Kiloniella antarctica TaxID=1550907 RepID=A0ABW5BJF9_9PROT